MRVPLSWLQEYVDITLTPEELADKLTLAGIAVEAIERLQPEFKGVVTGLIKEIEPHPHADHLLICRVDVGGRILSLVTGAPNVAVGCKVAVALEGARLPGGVEIRRASFRGVESAGMLCSAQELGLDTSLISPEEREGIILLPPDALPGSDVSQVLGLHETILELELTPNRADCLGIINVAREVAALTGAYLRLPSVEVTESEMRAADLAEIEIEATDLCGRYVARIVGGVRIGPSPAWIQARLRAAGMRPINNIVDVTNYVMLELNQPLHAFDYDLLQQHRIIVRRAAPGEKIVTLDGVERDLDEEMLVIADAGRAVAVAGVMGGLNTEVTSETVNVLIESAHFDGSSIRRTSRRLGLRSEASLRFERGVDIEGAALAADRAAQLMAQLSGGKVARGRLDCYACPRAKTVITLRPERLNELLGTDLTPGTIREYLERLHLKVEGERVLQVTVPSYRGDLTQEIDLVEEVARLYGYDAIPVTLPGSNTADEKETPRRRWEEAGREAAVACGLSEVITYSFINPKVFDWLRLPPDHPWRRVVKLQNPLREEQAVLRPSLLPGLLEVAARNANRKVLPVTIFEIGRVFKPGDAELPEEPLCLSALVLGELPKGWDWPPQVLDFYYLKGIVEEILERLRVGNVRFEPASEYPFLHPGRAAFVLSGDTPLGFLGEIYPDVAAAYDLPARTCVFELDWDLAGQKAEIGATYRPLSRFPAVERDLAVVVDEEIPSVALEEVICAAGGEILSSCRLFDVYRGGQIPPNKKSMAYELVFQHPDRTLTDQEVNARYLAIQETLERKLGAVLRR
ncbi:MAG: phenylalanyl-tRNA synthetase beta chain [Clostridia bacterium]|nr:phenylalanyl-tRNA synthetase beta chain [Clostridia bacterium]